MTIGQRIAQLRKQNNLSQEALGAELGVSRQAISKWESDAALPEIEKLIALSKRFSVTVGYLLGVEEEVQQAEPSEESAEAQSDKPTEAEVLERYLNQLPKQKPMSKRNKILVAVAAVLLVVFVLSCLYGLHKGLGQTRNDLSNLNNSVSHLEGQLNGLSHEISNQVEEAMQQEYGLLAHWELNLTDVDYQAGLGTVELRAVVRNPVEDASKLRFYVQKTDGTIAEEVERQWDEANQRYTATVQVPLTETNAIYYMTTPDGTICVAKNYEHAVTNLQEYTLPNVEMYMTNSSDNRKFRLHVDMHVIIPFVMEDEQGEAEEPEVKMWLATDSQRLSPLPVQAEKYNTNPYIYSAGVEGPNSGLADYEDETLHVEYEITFSNGYVVSGRMNETLSMSSSGFWQEEVQ